MRTILVAGIGGVGGYVGGKLSKHFEENEAVQIHFLARGENARAIAEFGLQVKDGDNLFLTHPCAVHSKLNGKIKFDAIIICVKSYHLSELLDEIKDSVHEETVILPLLNGIEPAEIISRRFPSNTVAKACIYLISALTHPGKIDSTGFVNKIYMGSDKNEKALEPLFRLMQAAKLEVELRHDIKRLIWEKFIFISAIAGATTYYDQTIGELFEEQIKQHFVEQLLQEISVLARRLEPSISPKIAQDTLEKFKQLPYSATSSMHRDAQAGRQTEYENLAGYVVREAKRAGIACPAFNILYAEFQMQKESLLTKV